MASKISVKRIFFLLRISILLVVAGGAGLLAMWSRTADPRFYLVLHSREAQALFSSIGWDKYIAAHSGGEIKPLTERELELKEKLEAHLREAQPSHRLVLKDGVVLEGRLISESSRKVVFQEQYGDNGGMSLTIKRSRIRAIEAYDMDIPEISARDVRFAMEFPDYNLYRRPPYSIVTDEAFFEVESAVQELSRLYEGFAQEFSELVTRDGADDHIQVVFISTQEEFDRYQKRFAPNMENSAGFYNPFIDRLVLFNQQGSEAVKESEAALRESEKRYLSRAGKYGGEGRIREWARNHERNLLQAAEEETKKTIRHEGAHQLFYTHGIHSVIHQENTWLVEGLAVYCETRKIGQRDGQRIEVLKWAARRGELVPLSTLVNSRSPHGFLGMNDGESSSLLYAQSWALVHMFMNGPYRDSFFDYIRYVRNQKNLKPLLKEDRLSILLDHLNLASEQVLQQELEGHIRRM